MNLRSWLIERGPALNRRRAFLAALLAGLVILDLRLILGGVPLWAVSAVVVGPYVIAGIGIPATAPRRKRLWAIAEQAQRSGAEAVVVPFANEDFVYRLRSALRRRSDLSDVDARAVKRGFIAVFDERGLRIVVPSSPDSWRTVATVPRASLVAVSLEEGFFPEKVSDRKLHVRTTRAKLVLPLFATPANFASMSREDAAALAERLGRLLEHGSGESARD